MKRHKVLTGIVSQFQESFIQNHDNLKNHDLTHHDHQTLRLPQTRPGAIWTDEGTAQEHNYEG